MPTDCSELCLQNRCMPRTIVILTSTEAGSIRNLILPIFEAETAAIAPKLVDEGYLKKDFYDEFGTRGNFLEAENQYKAFVQGVDNISPFFVVSFCRHPDDSPEYEQGLLSQWRGYADTGGFAIEFDEDKLDALARLEQISFAYVGFRSLDVEYKSHEKIFVREDYVGVAGDIIRGMFGTIGQDVSDITGRTSISEAVVKYAKTAPFLKHPGFYEEQEYRLVFVCLRVSKIDQSEKRPPKEIKFRNKGGLLVPFIELFKLHPPSLPIKGIIVGPHPLQEKQAESVRMLIEREGFRDVMIRLSNIPYRK
jgi:hypothetical protein